MGVFTRVKSATTEDVRKENPALFEQIFDMGHDEGSKISKESLTEVEKLSNENKELLERIEVVEKENKDLKEGASIDSKLKIISFASKFGLVAETCEMISKGKSNEDIYEFIAENGKAQSSGDNSNSEEKLLGIFEKTAPPTAGEGKNDEMDCESIKTYAEARDYIMKRDGCSKAEAASKARVEFKDICDREFNTNVYGTEVEQETEQVEVEQETEQIEAEQETEQE